MRDVTRYRKAPIQERTREAQRLHKIIEGSGIKLANVATDILGVSGRAMLNALMALESRSGPGPRRWRAGGCYART